MTQKWTADDMPDLSGQVAVVTGANSGTGFEAAQELARHGAEVVLACRNMEKAERAATEIRQAVPQAQLQIIRLDLADLSSVRQFAATFQARYSTLNMLGNNAGVMALPRRQTADGFEMQFGTNHLGHFALTGLLLKPLLQTPGSRIVTMSSIAHRQGKIDFADLHGENSYEKWKAYGQSKLANLLFAYELQRKLEAVPQTETISVAAHPGYAATNLQLVGPQMADSSWQERLWGVINKLFAQSAHKGALPLLYAATASDVRGGDYIGPDGFMEAWGHPQKVQSNEASYDRVVAQQLWAVSEELTGVTYEALASA